MPTTPASSQPATPDAPQPNQLFFVVTLLLFIVLGSFMTDLDKDLVTAHASKGMISYEMSFANQEQIAQEWREKHVMSTAIVQVWCDFPFVVVYVILLWQLLIYTQPGIWERYGTKKNWIKVGLGFVIAAGATDFIENICILFSLRGSETLGSVVPIASRIKFVLVGICAVGILLGGLRWLSKKADTFLNDLLIFRFVALSLLMLFFILWFSDQGQDLLLSLNTTGVLFSLVALTVLSLCSWFFPKYYTEREPKDFSLKSFFKGTWNYTPKAKATDKENDKTVRKQKFTGRILGTLGFLIPAVSIMHAMQTFKIPYLLDFIHPLVMLVMIVIFYNVVLVKEWWCNWRAFMNVSIVSLGIMVTGAIISDQTSSFLSSLVIDCLLLSFMFLLYTNVRTSKTKLSVSQKSITPYITISGAVVTALFIVFNIYPPFFAFPNHYRFVALPVAISGIIFYLYVLSVLKIVGKRYGVHLITLAMIIMFLLVSVLPNNFHRVPFVIKATDTTVSKVPMETLYDYTSRWLDARKIDIAFYDSVYHKPYPVFFVNAHGGGIRAAAWTAKYIQHLDDRVFAVRRNVHSGELATMYDFQHYVFSYSGASGGTMGAAVLCAQRYQQMKDKADNPHGDTSFFASDFLTPVVIPLLGRDVWFAFLGQESIPDRARFQEETWEKHAKNAQPSFCMTMPMSDYWKDPDTYAKIPLLFANSYYLDSGLKAIVAPVKLEQIDFPATYIVNNNSDSAEPVLSTAALLSARFPFISPAGEIDDFHHLMDGGLKENSGAETSSEVREVFRSVMIAKGIDTNKIQMIMLSVNNSLAKDADTLKAAKNVFELGAPLTALANNWIGNTRKAERVNKESQLAKHYLYLNVQPAVPDSLREGFQPVFPLGWQISDSGLSLMNICLDHKDVESVTNQIVKLITEVKPPRENRNSAVPAMQTQAAKYKH